MCKEQISVSKSSTESEVDAGLRMDGIPALDLWDLVRSTAFFESTHRTGKPVSLWAIRKRRSNAKTKKHSNPLEDPGLTNLDSFTSNAKISRNDALLYIFLRPWSSYQDDYQRKKSDVETWFPYPQSCARFVIWLDQFGPQNQNQIRWYQNHLVDILTKGSFLREEWNHLLRLFNIMNISKFSCSHFSPISAPQTMSKRLIRKTRRRWTRGCKIKTNAESGVEDYQWNFNSAEFEYISEPRDTCSNKFMFGFHQFGKPVARDSNANAASSSQARQPHVNPSSSKGTPVAETT